MSFLTFRLPTLSENSVKASNVHNVKAKSINKLVAKQLHLQTVMVKG